MRQDAALTVNEAMEWTGAVTDDLDAVTTIDIGGVTASDFGTSMAWSVVVAIVLDVAMAINFCTVME